MRANPAILLALSLTAIAARPGSGLAAELGTPPHFLMLADRERIVLFSDGPVAGALADRRADGSIVVTVPKVGAGAAIVGREFDDAGSGGSGGTRVRVSGDPQGDARIEITSTSAVARVHAYATGKPARLTIDLLQEGAQADRAADPARAGAKPAAAETATVAAAEGAEAKPAAAAEPKPQTPPKSEPVAVAATKPEPAPVAAAKSEPAAAAVAKPEPAPVVATKGEPAPGVVAKNEPAPVAKTEHAPAAAAARPEVAPAPVAQTKNDTPPAAHAARDAVAHGTIAPTETIPAAASASRDVPPLLEDDNRDLPAPPAAAPVVAQAPVATPTASPAVTAKDKKGKKGKAAEVVVTAPAPAPVAPGAVAAPNAAPAVVPASAPAVAAEAVASPPAPAAPQTLVCRWRRVGGIPYCAPDPKAGIYAADLGTAEIAGLLDRARSGPTLVQLPNQGPAEAHLNADVTLVRAAKSGYLLPALAEYEHALRTYPAFEDASRSRANVALIYHTLGFAPELARLSRAKDDPVAPFAAVLLADLWRDRDEKHDLAPLLAAGRNAGGITNCIAERVAANLAADEKRAAAFPAAFAELSKVCPRTILEDSETAWLRGRAMVLGGEASRAAEVLPPLEEDLPRRERALLLADVVAAQDAAGNAQAARLTEERLAGGDLGRRAARNARLALAARDAAEGKLGDIGGRFADLPIEDALQTRERADLIAVGELLRQGNEIAALGMMTERKVEARSLAPADQLLLARALRKVGLLDQSRRVLAGIAAATTSRLPDGYYEETGALALAHDDAPGALDVVEQWRVARGGNAPAGAIALKARARAAKGDARGATEALEKELTPLDPVLARDVAVELAGQLRSADPAAAMRLAEGALKDSALPPLDAPREAAALAALADAAEATGDKATAQSAFTRLAREYANEPAAAGAAYRASRLASSAPAQAAHAPAGAPPAASQQVAAKAPAPAAAPIVDDDPLSRRLAAAGRVYAEVVAGMQGTKP
ncbi:MAG: hypothetical protein U0842_15400 [Candidatus Binatia bacterium]